MSLLQTTGQTIPVVDLMEFRAGVAAQRDDFVMTVGNALAEVGFFAVVNHGVPPQLIQSAYQVAAEFFALPDANKLAYENPQWQGQRGFTHFGKEHAKGQLAPDLKEFWHVGRELSTSEPACVLPKDPDPAGLWFPNPWPQEVPAFQLVMTALYQQLETCAESLLESIALYLGEPPHLLTDMVRLGATLLRIIHYPPLPAHGSPQGMRAAAHEDINLITLLCESTAPGLELLQRDGSWLPIQPLPGQIIVDAGDMLQQLTNGLLKSTTHRVTNPDNDRERRFSMPFFVHPRPEVDLTPLPSCLTRTGGKPRFPSITAQQYLQQRLQEIGLA
ncbi:MAG: 2-oxoglutarate and iron-dependent oxygenase domain-containing protein [Cyanobacteriota bacterium]|nr:2-oxoglutarate and iron-dependent oxygenase domain-containing protein [Cyanobacteriota bacterium]